MKPPKHIIHFLVEAGLRIDSDSKRRRIPYFDGYGRKWRVSVGGTLEASEKLEDFDRWANSKLCGTDGSVYSMNKHQIKEIVVLMNSLCEEIESVVGRCK